MFKRIKICFQRWNELGCPLCKHTTFECVTMSSGPWGTDEFALICNKCLSEVNYWAYGKYLYPTTKIQLYSFKLKNLKLKTIDIWNKMSKRL